MMRYKSANADCFNCPGFCFKNFKRSPVNRALFLFWSKKEGRHSIKESTGYILGRLGTLVKY